MPDIDRSKKVGSNVPDLEATTEAGLGTQDNHVRIAANDDTAPAVLRFGSYEVIRELGSGAFGSVYQARHSDNGSIVAVKALKEKWARDPECGPQMRSQFAAEAQMMLLFDHPRVVRVIALDDRADPPYFVQEFIDGETLAQRLLRGKPTLEETLNFAIQITDGLAHIHSRERWHRDLKPANILLDRDNQVHLADFGLALDDAQRWQSARGAAGTFPYMAPEQIRGATHLLNARCDLWALGVILYEMLSGKRPFQGETRSQLCGEILERTPTSPREIIPEVPRKLNRICMQCLSKRDSDRPDAAADVREDLREVLARLRSGEDSAGLSNSGTTTTVSPAALTTKTSVQYPIPTLRRFTAEQVELYLRLMPKSYNNPEELPELVGYWKQRIVSGNRHDTFRIGVMVGVSGCGKSSLLEAGLVPSLPAEIVPILIEASDTETETRILSKLRQAFPDADPSGTWELADWTFRLREGQILAAGQKVVIILDQFEQWLNAHGGKPSSPLLDALHQCDGKHLQAIVCVREGFHATLMRFVDSMQIVLDGDANYATAHRFSLDHARFVLEQFGRGLKRLADPIASDEASFIEAAVEGLAESDRGVVCVRLVVLALVMQDRPWTIEELDKLGGLDGIGAQFLVDCFEGRTASEQYRRYLPAAMRVLADLLPAEGLEIKDVRSYEELQAASGLDKLQFDDLLTILTRKLFLLTPVEAEADATASDSSHSPLATRYFQLTHDFLVPSIREWLAVKERQTRAGRARLKLAERTAAWRVKRERKQLPTPLEVATIYWRTDTKRWTQDQRVMMRAAVKHHSLIWGTAAVLLLATGITLRTWQSQRELALAREQLQVAAGALQNNLGPSIPGNIVELKKLPESLVVDELVERFATVNSRHKLAVAFALAAYGRPESDYLVSRIDDIAVFDMANFVDALSLDREQALAKIKAAAEQCVSEDLWRRKAKLAITALALGETGIAADMCQYENRPDPGQRTIFIHEFPEWEWHLANRELDLSRLAQRVSEIQDSGLRSGLCLAVGSIPKDRVQEVNPNAVESWSQLASRWFAEHPDTSTHSAGRWLLQRWEIPLPEVPGMNQIRSDRDWFVNSAGMTMLRMEPPPKKASPGITLNDPFDRYRQKVIELPASEYWIASCEVTRTQFVTFMQDVDYTDDKPTDLKFFPQESPTADHPAENVSWFDAVMYCNWLSVREGKIPAYRKTGKREYHRYLNDELDEWELVPHASGYRLPLETEWEYTARAGSSTAWSSGSDELLLPDYCQMFPSKLASEVGNKLPNAWGVHDMQGNVTEWCHDLEFSYFRDMSGRVYRGGSWLNAATMCQTTERDVCEPARRTSSFGFRLALSPSGVSGMVEPAAGEGEPGAVRTEGVEEQ